MKITDIAVHQRLDLAGKSWQITIILPTGIRRHLIDKPADLDQLIMRGGHACSGCDGVHVGTFGDGLDWSTKRLRD